MSNNAGFIYALINPSLSGLVKVGKTKRDTQERANELSGTTGVPTPFIVAYEIFVSDCTQAEMCLHTLLETKGYRISKNREFFDIPLKELIPIMIEVQKKYPANIENDTNDNIEDFVETSNLGNDLLAEAMKHYNGDDNYLQDYSEAIKLMKQAAKLGVKEAYYLLGKMYRIGEGCNSDFNIAIEYLKKGVNAGYKRCYQEMAYLYLYDLKHYDNAKKSWGKFKKCKYYTSLDPYEQEMLDDKFSEKLGLYHFIDYDIKKKYLYEEDFYKPWAELYCAGLEIMDEGKKIKIDNRIYKDSHDAVEIFTRAIELGCCEAYNKLYYHYYYGDGCEENLNIAIAYSKIGANKGNCYCWQDLSEYYKEKNLYKLSKICNQKYVKLSDRNKGVVDKTNSNDGFLFNIENEKEYLQYFEKNNAEKDLHIENDIIIEKSDWIDRYIDDFDYKNQTGRKTEYFKNGNIKSIKNYPKGMLKGILNGPIKTYFSNGNIKCEGAYDFGHKKGKFIEYFSDGKKKRIEIWKNRKLLETKKYNKGVLHGPMKIFFSSGILQYEGLYDFGHKNGEFIEYFSDGKKKRIEIWKNRELMETKKYNKSGKREVDQNIKKLEKELEDKTLNIYTHLKENERVIEKNIIEKKMKSIISSFYRIKDDEITAETRFFEDLGSDSLDDVELIMQDVELIMQFEEEFDIEIPDEDAEKLTTVGDALEYLENKIEEKTKNRRIILRQMGELSRITIFKKVKGIIATQLGTTKDEITLDARFIEDLGVDSLGAIKLIMQFEEEFDIEIPNEDVEKFTTVGTALKYLEKKLIDDD